MRSGRRKATSSRNREAGRALRLTGSGDIAGSALPCFQAGGGSQVSGGSWIAFAARPQPDLGAIVAGAVLALRRTQTTPPHTHLLSSSGCLRPPVLSAPS
ncbi:uncharacterized protein LOC123943442 isoform X4 [Meles meles]|uniref:uncharacterized protein LOC123943442 isoform X4 n=1 Tax=Meles meles TaxID=9662 RepID=UPI001E69EB2A|nr:uncharacterized protein LOC123943442 isoform X4 [Meles meles]